jgi:hypothetical protein
MSGKPDSPGAGLVIDTAAKAVFLAAMRQGMRLQEVADGFGVTLQAFYAARRRDPQFAAQWQEMHELSAAAERGHGPPDEGRAGGLGEGRIAPNNRRGLQRRKMRHVRFTEKRRETFLAHFSWSCDTLAAAAEAGVCESTVHSHRRKDPGFALEYEEALEQGYVLLEAEALRQRLAAQERLRAAMDGAEPLVAGETAAEFERMLKLLARRDRKARGPDRRAAPGGRRQVWTFDAAIVLLDERLRALGVEVPALPPDSAERYDGPGEG